MNLGDRRHRSTHSDIFMLQITATLSKFEDPKEGNVFPAKLQDISWKVGKDR